MITTNLIHTILAIAANPPLKGHAYLDPGSGSFLLQLLIAGLVGSAFIVKAFWGKITALFKRKPTDQAQNDDTTDQPQ